ncbi:CCR4-NOT transcription complex subunit 2-like isoform X3 [Metopolophium dirhodum]|uniref:CCR4-NOT transcription complex subunit 2-like isoform X3 n=1 Tax=Metopolophium dirhodum TaxID=44670 RepID=UPI00299067B0|nr:CCR4-NOT transcription complex subunit 2-like isoform X3 [Metopolophium dirhodum]
MVRSKKRSSSNKSFKNMHPSQFNNPRRNGNNLGGHTPDMNMQNHNMMPNAMSQNIANISKQDHNTMPNLVTQNIANFNRQNLNMMVNAVSQNTTNMNKQDHNMMPNLVAQSLANLNRQNLSIILNGMTQNTANMNKQDHDMMPNHVTQSIANMNKQNFNMMPNPVTQSIANFNRQTHNMIPNAVTQLPQWHSQITMSDILNNYVDGPNSSNSLFTSGRDLSPQSNFHPTFDCIQINNSNGTHSLIEQSNFPLINEQDLSDNGPRDNTGSQYSNTVPVGRPYGKHSLFKKYDHYFSFKVMKTSNSDTSEFKMLNKDFPALPGTQVQMQDDANTPSTMIDSNQQWSSNTNVGSKLFNKLNMDQFIDHNSCGIHLDTDFHMNGKVTNIPSSMLRDQFGIIGQLITMRTAEYDPKLVALTFGQDLTSLGMNLNSPENIYPTFAGPFENSPLEPHNIEFDVPSEYKIHHKIKNKLAPIKFSEYKEDLLFYLFYTHFGDGIQMAVASELRTRGWRYHTGQHVWITPVSRSSMSDMDGKFERGTFYVFDVALWRKVPRELMLDHTLLDGCVANDSFIWPDTSTR